MSIKSDKWIRRMSQQQGMIEPYVDQQVRQPDPQGSAGDFLWNLKLWL